MDEIKDYVHTFEIDGQEIQILINYINGYWTSKIKKGDTGCGGSSGGIYDSLSDYIKEQEKQHGYAYYFFNKGHKIAKELINEK